MLIASWCRRSITGSPARSRRSGPRHTRSGLPVLRHLEVLEDRACPSTLFPVTNLLDSGPGSLRAAITAANATAGVDLINFTPGLHGTIKLASGEPAITAANLTINGPGENQLTVSGNNAYRVFDIGAGATVKIDNLTIADGLTVGGNGGGILNEAGATLNLDHVVVTNNSAYADSLGNFGSGGGIENDGSLTVTESIFTNNLASGGNFTNATSGSAGGAIDSNGPSLTVTDSAFTNNQAGGPSTGTGEGNGGAINNSSTATITNSTFNGNLALGRNTNGGAISCGETETSTPLAISDCTFTGNKAIGANGANNFTEPFGGQGSGGDIISACPLTITASKFTDNLAKGGDQADNLGGFLPPGNGWVSTAYGGGVENFSNSLTVTGTTFTGNQAIGGNSAAGVGGGSVGGGIMSWGGSTSLTDVTLVGNQAIGGSGGPGYKGGSGFGGGFYNGISSTAAVSDSLFAGNLAQGGSGGLGVVGAVGVGGAIANGGGLGAMQIAALSLPPDTSSLSLTGSTLISNVAQGGAGGGAGALEAAVWEAAVTC